MLKRLLIAVLFIGVGFNTFANDSRIPSRSEPSNMILFVDMGKVFAESDEAKYLSARLNLFDEQYELLNQARGDGCDDSSLIDEFRQLDKKAMEVARQHQMPIWKSEARLREKVQSIIKKRASSLKAALVVTSASYVDPSRDITCYVINALNKEYGENPKRAYPVCELSSFTYRMKEIKSVQK